MFTSIDKLASNELRIMKRQKKKVITIESSVENLVIEFSS